MKTLGEVELVRERERERARGGGHLYENMGTTYVQRVFVGGYYIWRPYFKYDLVEKNIICLYEPNAKPRSYAPWVLPTTKIHMDFSLDAYMH